MISRLFVVDVASTDMATPIDYHAKQGAIMTNSTRIAVAAEPADLSTPLLANDALELQQSHQYIADPGRWIVLAAFSIANMTNALLWVSFAPIVPLAESYYGVSDTFINLFSVSYLVAYIPGSVAALVVYSFRQDGLRIGIVASSFVSAVGAFVRYFASAHYGISLFGQCLAAISQPFLTNIPPKISAAWFPSSERDVATVIGSMANPVGIAIGTILPVVFVTESDTQVKGMSTLLLIEAFLTTIGAIVAAVFIKSRPCVPPSAAAAKEALQATNENSEPVFQALSSNVMICMRNGHFRVLFVAFAIGLGMFNALTTLTEQLIAPFCYTDDDASLFSALPLLCGLVFSAVVGVYLDKSHRYQFMLKLLFSLATLTLLLFSITLRPNARPELAVVFAILGATMLPILPTALEAAVECTYPVAEEYSACIIMSFGMLLGIVFIFGLQQLVDVQPPCKGDNDDHYYFSWASGVLILSGLVATLTVFQFHGPLLRLQAEQEADYVMLGEWQ